MSEKSTEKVEVWDSEQCEIMDESGLSFDVVQESLKLNDDIKRIIQLSKRNWLLDPIIVSNQIKHLKQTIKEEFYYLKIDLQQQSKEVIKNIYRRIKKAVKA